MPSTAVVRLTRLVRNVSISRTLFSNWRQLKSKNLKLILGRRAYLSMGRGADLRISRRLSVGVGRQVLAPTRVEIHKHGVLKVDGSAEIRGGCFIRVGEHASLAIGDRTRVNSGARISSSSTVSLGDDCRIGFDVIVMDNDYHHVIIGGEERASCKPITIGDHVWIGARAIVLKGVTIGSGSVIAAGAVVSRDVPPNSLAGGSPMKILREGVSWRG